MDQNRLRTKRNNFTKAFCEFSETSSYRLHLLGVLHICGSCKSCQCQCNIRYNHDNKRTRSSTICTRFSAMLFSLGTMQLEAYFTEIPSRDTIL